MGKSCLLDLFLLNYLVNQEVLTAREMDYLVKVSTVTSEDWSSISGTYRVEGETTYQQRHRHTHKGHTCAGKANK